MEVKEAILQYLLTLQFGGKYKWKTLSHNGVLFPPKYVPHNIPVIYNGEHVHLDSSAEEVATMYAKYIDTEYTQNKTFNKNFWHDWKKILGSSHVIQNLENCDFKLIYDHILEVHGKKKEDTKENKEESKKQRALEEEKFKIAIVDDKPQPVGNFRMEPPGIFIGRGCNPKLGKLKKRIQPEDIIINIGKESKIPECLDGHKWKKVIHDKSVEWLASWKDAITGKMKYMWLGAHSDFKAASDQSKFDLARKLKKKIKLINQENEKNMSSSDVKLRQTATALYFIDKLALRVGNEKSSDETDTVGVTSLRVEHIDVKTDQQITLDFLGKDSVRYHNTIKVESNVYNNIADFLRDKIKDDQLFDLINANDINKYLQTFMKGLTAKVFRTYNASLLFQKEIKKINNKFESDSNKNLSVLMDEYSKANAKVAMLCNHQKNINKSFKIQVEKMEGSIKSIKSKLRKAKSSKKKNSDKINKLTDQLKKAKSKKELKMQLKNIALGTSKSNYIDPRITVAFMKLHNIPVDKVFSKTLQEKFKWAFGVESDFKF